MIYVFFCVYFCIILSWVCGNNYDILSARECSASNPFYVSGGFHGCALIVGSENIVIQEVIFAHWFISLGWDVIIVVSDIKWQMPFSN